MLSKQQQKDSDECERMMENGEGDKDCAGCSCSVCIAQVSTGYDPATVNKAAESLMNQASVLIDKYKDANNNTQLANLCDKMADFAQDVFKVLSDMTKGE